MRLHSLKIQGFKRIELADVLFGDATFLIGPNNAGKSTVLKAIEWLLSGKKQIPSQEYFSTIDEETGETKPAVNTIILEAEFRNLPPESVYWRGFKGRIFSYEPVNESDSGLSVTYRKTYPLGKDVIIEFRSKKRTLRPEFSSFKTAQDLVDAGIRMETVIEQFADLSAKIGTSKAATDKLELLDDMWDTTDEEIWFQNPGGIPGNVLKMLPRFLLIPTDASANEIEGNSSGVLGKTLLELFEDVRSASDNYAKAQGYLNELAKELDPQDDESEFGKMVAELNLILAGVFPDTKIHAKASLSDPQTVLKPTFTVELSSNVKTAVSQQGTGMVRAAVFGMLRYRQKWLSTKEDNHKRSLIICFEEPEIYLHPSAANQMRDTIYELSCSDSQIVASTHSPFLIDLSRKPRQILNSIRHSQKGMDCIPFNVTKAYSELQNEDKSYVKMLLRVDDHIARVFFTKHVVVVEGDTEEIVLKETLKRLPKDKYLRIVSEFEIVKARGKASIIGLSKYLISMGINPVVVHDRDLGIAGAEVFNQPIADSVNGCGRVIQFCENIEDELEYKAPSYEKPFKAYLETVKWGESWDDIPIKWRLKIKEIFGDYI